MKNELISIIVPAYNAEKYLKETILSVQQQTYKNWELIIVNDGSTDNTSSIINEFSSNDSRIKYYYQPNGKQAKARNFAISKSSGYYLAFIDADDLWHPEKLEKQINVFRRFSHIDLVYTNGISFVNTIENVISIDSEVEGFIDADIQFKSLLLGKSIPNLSVMLKRQVVLSVGGFMEDLRIQNAEDYQLWINLADKDINFYCLSEYLFFYRIHDGQVTFGDGLAFKNAIWALYLSNLRKINNSLKMKLLKIRLNRYLLHNIDDLTNKEFLDINKLYLHIIKNPFLYVINLLLFFVSRSLYKKIYYSQRRLTDLKIDQN